MAIPIHLYLLEYPLCVFIPLTATCDDVPEQPLARRLMTIAGRHTGSYFEEKTIVGDDVQRKTVKASSDFMQRPQVFRRKLIRGR